ncbi:hypothetical protein Q5424_00895 [Conexibacter sp. JD483]|uniref:hypothetical protein n=1 Tax=unclassified Conexibacter TaxID=2627773 RepID=UPI00271E9D22|nr:MULTISPECIES: hypothetical protein [unclassified Conexibacter]MDO8189031.1 hypothetical protein [Conexibacter sp. CPCC 205706]MDO8198528.1 hypothetical protein [Conexibacter sp. CPCC 205762]MDR9367614.1 hypothetical protein [Conexibacter sp. JD483]
MTAPRCPRALGAAVAGLVLAGAVPAVSAASPAAMRLKASVAADARLGEPTALRLQLHLDRRRGAVARRLTLRYAAGIDIIGSGLGLATCRPSPATFAAVAIDPLPVRAGCPANAVIAIGRARGQIRLHPPTITQTATFTLLAGPLDPTGLKVVGLVTGINPFGANLVYAGMVTADRGPFGGRIDVALPRIPDVFPDDTSDVALLDVDATIGSKAIVYQRRDRRGRVRRWHPDGPILPARCPRGGLPFRAEVLLSDGATITATARATCPPRARPRTPGDGAEPRAASR